jgi:hypothetical protein
MYAGALFFTAAMYQALRAITTSTAWAAISPRDTMNVIADGIFRIQGPRPIPVAAAVVVVAVLIAASIWVLERRVRGVEVVT